MIVWNIAASPAVAGVDANFLRPLRSLFKIESTRRKNFPLVCQAGISKTGHYLLEYPSRARTTIELYDEWLACSHVKAKLC